MATEAAVTGSTFYQDNITLFFNADLAAGSLDTSNWTVTVNGVALTPASVEIDPRVGALASDTTLLITLPQQLSFGDSINVTYAADAGAAGNLAFEGDLPLFGNSWNVYNDTEYGPGLWGPVSKATGIIQGAIVWSGLVYDGNVTQIGSYLSGLTTSGDDGFILDANTYMALLQVNTQHYPVPHTSLFNNIYWTGKAIDETFFTVAADWVAKSSDDSLFVVSDTGSGTITGGDGDDLLVSGSGVTDDGSTQTFSLLSSSLSVNSSNNHQQPVPTLTLDGKRGADTMIGGAENDIYKVDNPGDVVSEKANAGTDTVKTTIAMTLPDNVENLVMERSGAATGNGMNNIITGSAGGDTLDGAAGSDILTGGAGHDLFVFHAGEGNGDIIADFALGDRIEFDGYGRGATLTSLGHNQYQVASADHSEVDVITVLGQHKIDSHSYFFS